MNPQRVRTDEEMLAVDVPAHIRDHLAGGSGPAGAAIDGDATVAAAIAADRLGVYPRSLTFLAEVVRRGSRAYAVDLTDPLPTPEQVELARPWLSAAAQAPASFDLDEVFARW